MTQNKAAQNKAAQNKTGATEVSVSAFVDAVPDAVRREDARAICAMMAEVSGEAPRMWGPSIIGFGVHRYRYESGREGEICRIGFSPRKAEQVLYGLALDEALERLGRHRTGKGCLYVRRLADVDVGVLRSMIADAWARRG
ncbi:DUF1801 domain-containing protein [Sphingomonas sp.]|uniref:DUF1801 domain-containing protein n=1 Tax=Sphingomonas sp. TaxID=28214 RepID=UPI001ED62B55|nr:DUF1801 domain-containing protein [Sphingomonas sp.]MBX3595578.1 DUF1801 domain-containing protein [Sphingomonas sp.]